MDQVIDFTNTEDAGNARVWLEKVLSQSKFTFLVYYRGHWCPFCKSYLSELAKLYPAIVEKNGNVVCFTADSKEEVEKSVREWNLPFSVVSDPKHVVATVLQEMKVVSVIVTGSNGTPGYDTYFYRNHPKMKLYANGVAQPAVALVSQNLQVLFRWRVDPSVMNIGGAKDRPRLRDVFTIAKAYVDTGKVKPTVDANTSPTAVRFTKLTDLCQIL